MTDTEGYHRTPMRRRPNARQRQVLDALVDGKTNPQIAADLGITLDGAKWHVSQLLVETDLSTREELAHWWSMQRSKTPALLPFGLTWTRLVAGTTFVAAIALVVLLAVALPHYREERAAALAEVVLTPTPETASSAASDAPDCNVDLPADFRIVTAAELKQEGLVEIGRVIDAQDCPLKVSNRVDRSFIAVVGDAKVDMVSAMLHHVTNFGGYPAGSPPNDLGFYYQSEQFILPITKASLESPPVAGALGRFPIQGQGKRESLTLSASRGSVINAVVGKGEASGYHRVAFDSDGLLFLDPQPVGGSIVIDGDTGKTIPTDGLTVIGRLPHENGPSDGAVSVNRFITTCIGNEGACNVVYWSRNESLLAPLSGVLTCLPPEEPYHPATGQVAVYEIVSGRYQLHVREEVPRDPAECEGGEVAAGQVVSPPGYFTLTARDEDGLPTSLVAAEDGRLYAGDVDAFSLRCPCSNGN